jgi:hypothetical protein
MLLAGSANSDWYLGLTLGFIIVTVVVIVVAVILSYASRIADQTRLANEGLEEVRTGTAPLWEVRKTNTSGVAILEAARTARGVVVAVVTGSAAPAQAPPRPEPQVFEPAPAPSDPWAPEPAQPEPASSEPPISWPPASEPAPPDPWAAAEPTPQPDAPASPPAGPASGEPAGALDLDNYPSMRQDDGNQTEGNPSGATGEDVSPQVRRLRRRRIVNRGGRS